MALAANFGAIAHRGHVNLLGVYKAAPRANAKVSLKAQPFLLQDEAFNMAMVSLVGALTGLGFVGRSRSRKQSVFAQKVSKLQGLWEDNAGCKIEVVGTTACFGDGKGIFEIREEHRGLTLREAELVITEAHSLVWQYSDGTISTWSRTVPVAPQDAAWAKVFFTFKNALLQFRKALWAETAAGNWAQVSALRKTWDKCGLSVPDVTFEQQIRLAAGRELGPGVCFTHRQCGYRGVIFACKPWFNAPRGRRNATNLDARQLQPYYHCLIDETSAPDGLDAMVITEDIQGAVALVAEEDIIPCEHAYPIENSVVDCLLVRCDELNGYLPNLLLNDLLRHQHAGVPLVTKQRTVP